MARYNRYTGAPMTISRGGRQFGQTAPAQRNARGQIVGPRTDVRYYQERAGQAASMQKVIGTTSAPSSDHQLSGFTPDGYAIWEKKPAPAPAPSGGGGGGGSPSPSQQMAIAQLTAESEKYRTQAEETIAKGRARISELEDEELQRQRATELQNRLAIQAQASQARGAQRAALQIAPAYQTARTAGTQAFKRRDRMKLAPIQTTAGINVPTGSVLNV